MAFCCIVPAYIIELARYYNNLEHLELEEAEHLHEIESALFKTIEVLAPATNLISCLILALVIRYIYKLSEQVEVGRDTATAKSKVNALVTGSHIGVTLAYTVTQIIIIFEKNPT